MCHKPRQHECANSLSRHVDTLILWVEAATLSGFTCVGDGIIGHSSEVEQRFRLCARADIRRQVELPETVAGVTRSWQATRMAASLQGVTREQQRELQEMLQRLAALWAELSAAASNPDDAKVDAINREIAACRERLDAIKRAGTQGTA